MTNPVFPTLSTGQDSSKYDVQLENTGMKSEMEGGYVVSRAKHTRTPRRTFTSGYTDISQADYDAFRAFWNTVRGSALIFDWTDPASGEVVPVRFVGDALDVKYAGVGYNRRWNIDYKVEEA